MGGWEKRDAMNWCERLAGEIGGRGSLFSTKFYSKGILGKLIFNNIPADKAGLLSSNVYVATKQGLCGKDESRLWKYGKKTTPFYMRFLFGGFAVDQTFITAWILTLALYLYN